MPCFLFQALIAREGSMAFLRAKGSENHHDLGLMEVGARAPRPPRGSIGLYHLSAAPVMPLDWEKELKREKQRAT